MFLVVLGQCKGLMLLKLDFGDEFILGYTMW